MKTRRTIVIEEEDLKALIQMNDERKPEGKDVKIIGAAPAYEQNDSGIYKYTIALSYEINP